MNNEYMNVSPGCDCDNCEAARATEAGTPATASIDDPNSDDESFYHAALLYRTAVTDASERYKQLVAIADQHAQARAEEARREEAAIYGPIINDLRAQLLHSTAGGDAVAVRAAIRKVLQQHDLTVHGDGVVEADIAHAVFSAQPVAEAAAQADGEQAKTGCAGMIFEGGPYCVGPCPACEYSRKLAAAPTAQPTPPDDELTDGDIIQLYMESTGGQHPASWHMEFARSVYARAALRHPPVPNVGGLRLPQVEVAARCAPQVIDSIGHIEDFAPSAAHQVAAQPTQAGAEIPTSTGDIPTSCATDAHKAGAEPAAAATIDTPEFRNLLTALDVAEERATSYGQPQHEQEAHEAYKAFVAHIDAAIKSHGDARYEEGSDESDATCRYMAKQIVDLRARLASAGAGEKGGAA